jgi:hypothetical protein
MPELPEMVTRFCISYLLVNFIIMPFCTQAQIGGRENSVVDIVNNNPVQKWSQERFMIHFMKYIFKAGNPR